MARRPESYGYDYNTVPGGYDPHGPGRGRFRRFTGFRPAGTDEVRDFFTALFDFRFDALVATRIVRVFYAVIVALAAVWSVGLVLGAFAGGALSGLITLFVIAPLLFVAVTAAARIVLELVIVLFRIGEDHLEGRNRGSGRR